MEEESQEIHLKKEEKMNKVKSRERKNYYSNGTGKLNRVKVKK